MTVHEDTILDHQALAELDEDLADEFDNFVRSFLTHAREALEAMDAACSDADALEVGRQAHALKGTAGYLGAARLSAQLDTLQRLGKAGDSQSMAVILAAARADFDELEIRLLRAVDGR